MRDQSTELTNKEVGVQALLSILGYRRDTLQQSDVLASTERDPLQIYCNIPNKNVKRLTMQYDKCVLITWNCLII